jgi:Spy/CpxP family protein refolding chaperone
MHPGFYHWWNSRRGGGDCGGEASCGHGGHGWHGRGGWGHEGPGSDERRFGGWGHHGGGDDDGGAFGVRRPLRFLAYKLELDEKQVGELARILSDLKTERAQAQVDQRRTTAAFADAIAGGTFDDAKAGEGAQQRVKSAERLKDAVVKALREIHAVLNEEQRQQLAYLVRTGVVVL